MQVRLKLNICNRNRVNLIPETAVTNTCSLRYMLVFDVYFCRNSIVVFNKSSDIFFPNLLTLARYTRNYGKPEWKPRFKGRSTLAFHTKYTSKAVNLLCGWYIFFPGAWFNYVYSQYSKGQLNISNLWPFYMLRVTGITLSSLCKNRRISIL